MGKERYFFLLIFFFIVTVSASINVNSINIENDYYVGDFLRGKLNISVNNESPDLYIGLSNDNSVKLVDLIRDNGLEPNCIPYSCEKGYSVLVSTNSRDVVLYNGEKELLGFYINSGNPVVIKNFNFLISSDFEEGFNKPLSFDFFDGYYSWDFNKFSNNLFSQNNYSCYSDNEAVFLNKKINNSQMYCSIFNFPDTGTITAGILRDGEDEKSVKVSLYYVNGASVSHKKSCEIFPGESECNLSLGGNEYFYSGKYYICIDSGSYLSTNYVLKENQNGKCGFVKEPDMDFNESNKKTSFGIYSKYSGYSNSSYLLFKNSDYDNLVKNANLYLNSVYNKDCSYGCILPVNIFSGANQNIKIEDVNIRYTSDKIDKTLNEISSIDNGSAKFFFNGTLDLFLGGFSVFFKDIILYISNTVIYSDSVNIKPSPKIKEVYPLSNIPLGIDVRFFVEIDGSANNLIYNWRIDDQFDKNTSNPEFLYKFSKSGEYILYLTVYSGNYSTSSNNVISVISPDINEIKSYYLIQQNQFNFLFTKLKNPDIWYYSEIWNLLNITSYRDDLQKIGKTLNISEITTTQKNDILLKLYTQSIPIDIFVSDSLNNLVYIPEKENIDLSIIKNYLGSKKNNYQEYIDVVVDWNNNFIFSNYSILNINFNTNTEKTHSLMKVYDINIKSNYATNSYLIINSPKEDLKFERDFGFISYNNKSILNLSSNLNKQIKFYTLNKDISWFFSPNIDDLILSSEIENYCNNDGICNKDSGENFLNCRSDCLAVNIFLKYLIFVFVFILFLYTFIQQWYSNNYEKRIFSDKMQLNNLIVFIKSSRNLGLKDSEIENKLLIEGWTEERVKYVFLKIRGRSIMPEIIPISKIKLLLKKKHN